MENREIQVAVSIGASMIRFEDNLESLIQRVDQNMYKSKTAGRNQISADDKSIK